MSIVSFVGRSVKIAKRMLLNGFLHSVTGVGMTMDGLEFLIKPVMVCACFIVIIQDANDIKGEIKKGQAMKKKLSERFAMIIRPCVYVSLHVLTLSLMSQATKSRVDREGFPIESNVSLGTLVRYSPSLVRHFDRWLIQKAEAKALQNHSFMVERQMMISQRSLYYMIRVFHSCLIIQNPFTAKSFYLSRQNSGINEQKQITTCQPQIYLGTNSTLKNSQVFISDSFIVPTDFFTVPK